MLRYGIGNDLLQSYRMSSDRTSTQSRTKTVEILYEICIETVAIMKPKDGYTGNAKQLLHISALLPTISWER